jgi:uncharacterized protein
MPRLYRESLGNERWASFRTGYLETDLWIAVTKSQYTPKAEAWALSYVELLRGILDDHIIQHPEFLISMVPLEGCAAGHSMITDMYIASCRALTGPMSAVAGAFAEYLAYALIDQYGFDEIIVENGGDVFMKIMQPATISVHAGDSPLSGKTGLVVTPDLSPLSVCCSSATVGHSISFGTADAAVVACGSGALADALATACCNSVKNAGMLKQVTEEYMNISGVLSVIIIKGDKMAAGGNLEVAIIK